MKTIQKCLLLSALLLSCLPALPAQMSEGGARFGLKIGVSGNSFYDDAQARDKKGHTGIVGGGFAKIRLTKHFSFRPELLFATRGGEFNYANLGKSDLKLRYVELPLSLEFNLLGFLNLHGGFHVGALAGQDGTFRDAQGNTLSFDLNRDDLNSFNYGWHLGGGIDLGNLGLHLRFLRGLQEVGKSETFHPFVGTLKNSAWELSVSYALK